MLEGTRDHDARLTLDKGLKSRVPSNLEDSKIGNIGILLRGHFLLSKPIIYHDPFVFQVFVVQAVTLELLTLSLVIHCSLNFLAV